MKVANSPYSFGFSDLKLSFLRPFRLPEVSIDGESFLELPFSNPKVISHFQSLG